MTVNPSGWRPSAPANEQGEAQTVTGNRALMLEEPLIFEIGATDQTGVDGTTFHFAGFCRGVGQLTGRTWSPDPDTPTGRLVALAEAVKAYSLAPSTDSTEALRKRARAVPSNRRLTARCT